MIILGLDPGTAITGYGGIRVVNFKISCIAYGVIRTPAEMPMPKRLQMIYEDLGQVISQYHPDEVAIEKLYFGRNVTTGISVGQARGVLLLRLAQANLPIGEYTPPQIKRALSGYGGAEKQQMQYMVQNFLKLPEIPQPDDAADALAIAICHAHSRSGLR
jgi:crossover junction endodeoxyribonuclease RuvC